MSQTAARPKTRRTLRLTATGLVVAAADGGPLVYQSGWSAAASFSEVVRGDHRGRSTEAGGAVTEADGVLPGGATVFDEQYPGVANLDRDLLQSLRKAATAAADHARPGRPLPDHDIQFHVNSGWRSPSYQNQLLREAVSEYGSEDEAARWVATTDTSPHVSGDAVDIVSIQATAWLSQHGAEYKLCQIYRNEPWHYELRPRGDRSWLPAYVRRPHARSEDAAVTGPSRRLRAHDGLLGWLAAVVVPARALRVA